MKNQYISSIQMADDCKSGSRPMLISQQNFAIDPEAERKSVAALKPQRERPAERFICLAENFHSFQLMESSKLRRSKSSKRGYHSGRKSQSCKKKQRAAYSYLKPGALAQFRDAQRSVRTVRSSIRKDIMYADKCTNTVEDQVTPNETVDGERALALSNFSSRVFPGSYGSACLNRKKLVAPKAVALNVLSQTSMGNYSSEITVDTVQESLLETLPIELLVRIVCKLQHDQIKSVFHVCERFRQAVIIAKQNHFNYTTPGRERELQMIPRPLSSVSNRLPFLSRVGADSGPARHASTLKAPRHASKPQAARISIAEMKQIAASLFPGSRNRVRQGRQPCLTKTALRSGSSHRVLFNEEELCQAIAQNSL